MQPKNVVLQDIGSKNKLTDNKIFLYENYVAGGSTTLYSLLITCFFVVIAKFMST